MTSASQVYVVIVLSDGRLASAGGTPFGITFWNLTSGTSITSTTTHTGTIYGLIQLKNTTTVVSASLDSTIKFWNSLTGVLIKTIWDTVWVVAFSALSSGFMAVGTCTTNVVQIWNFDNNTLISSMSGHTQCVNSLLQLPSGALVTSGSDGLVKIWDLTTYTLIKTLTSAGVTDVRSIFLLSNGLLAAAGTNNILLWDIAAETVVSTLIGHTALVLPVIQLNNGLIASGSVDLSVKLWDADTGNLLNTLTYHTNNVFGLAETATGQIVSGSLDKKIVIWNN